MKLTKAMRIAKRMPAYKNKRAAKVRWCKAVKAALTGKG
jgi:hypothetical protein